MKICKLIKHLYIAWLVLSLNFSMAWAQQEIRGKILDSENNSPVAGAIVSVVGTKSVTSAKDGRFRLLLPENEQEAYVVHIHAPLFKSYSQKHNTSEELTVYLEKTVPLGYYDVETGKLTGDVEFLSIDEDAVYPSFNIPDAIKGLFPGVQVFSFSGQPGELPSVTIRGLNTMIFNEEPLVIVDEIPGMMLEDIDVADIESVTVLKDAASAAIYGASGTNGVILVKTKRGIAGTKTININASYGMASGNHYPAKYHLLDGQRAFQYVNNLAASRGENINPFLGSEFVSGELINQNNLQNNDWQKEIFRMAPTQTYNISARGGDEKNLYYFSGSYSGEKGIIQGTNNERYAFRLNLDKELNKLFSFTGDVGFNRSVQSLMPLGFGAYNEGIVQSSLLYLPFLPAYDDNGAFYENPLNPAVNSPLAIIDAYAMNTARTGFSARGKLKVHISNKLKYIFGYSGNIVFEKFDKYVSIDKTFMGRLFRGVGESSAREQSLNDLNNSLVYSENFSGSDLTVFAGYYLHNNRIDFNHGFGTNYSTDFNPLLSAAGNKSGYSNVLDHKKSSFLAVADYAVHDKYFLHVSMRGDASSRFDDELYIFPGAGFKWDLKKENFLKDMDFFTMLNLSVSYGITGNDGLYRIGYDYGINKIPIMPGTVTDSLPGLNPDETLKVDSVRGHGRIYNTSGLKMETMSELNVGLDIGFFRNNLLLSADVYQRTTENLILPVLLPDNYFFNNLGSMTTRGIDLELSSRNVSGNTFSWNSGAVVSFLNNDVTSTSEYDDELFTGGLAGIREDNPLYSYYTADGGFLGKTLPDIFYSVKNNFRAGPFNLNVFLQGSVGNSMLNIDRFLLEQGTEYVNQAEDYSSSNEFDKYIEDASYLNIREVKLEYIVPAGVTQKINSQGAKIFVSAQNIYTFSGYSGYFSETSTYGLRGANIGGYPLPGYVFAGVNIRF